MSDVILDANVVLARFDAADVFHSVLARRLRERRREPEVAAAPGALRAALPAEMAPARASIATSTAFQG